MKSILTHALRPGFAPQLCMLIWGATPSLPIHAATRVPAYVQIVSVPAGTRIAPGNFDLIWEALESVRVGSRLVKVPIPISASTIYAYRFQSVVYAKNRVVLRDPIITGYTTSKSLAVTLEPGRKCELTITAFHANGSKRGTKKIVFGTTPLPSSPVEPSDGEQNVSPDIILAWRKLDGIGPSGYEYMIAKGTVADLSPVIGQLRKKSGEVQRTEISAALETSTTYYWKIRPYAGVWPEDWWTFTTAATSLGRTPMHNARRAEGVITFHWPPFSHPNVTLYGYRLKVAARAGDDIPDAIKQLFQDKPTEMSPGYFEQNTWEWWVEPLLSPTAMVPLPYLLGYEPFTSHYTLTVQPYGNGL